jgi:hypothetical protein
MPPLLHIIGAGITADVFLYEASDHFAFWILPDGAGEPNRDRFVVDSGRTPCGGSERDHGAFAAGG